MSSHHVVAMSMPIVYTTDGDHDPDGMLFTVKAHEPLLRWVRDRFEDDDRRLARLHTRAQRARLVVDGLERLEVMLDRLRRGSDEDLELLADLVRRESLPGHGEAAARPHDPPRRSHRAGAVRTALEATLDELHAALADLGDEDPPLVTMGPQERARRRDHWQAQLRLLEEAVEQWFADVEADPERRFDPARLADAVEAACGVRMPQERVRRLLVNDRGPGADPTGGYDRVHPMRPVPVVQPLVLRTHVGSTMTIEVENSLRGRRLGFHVQGDGLGGGESSGALTAGVTGGDGAHVGDNPDTTIAPGGPNRIFTYAARHEGVWPVNDCADVRGGEAGTNVHGLFGAIVVEPAGVTWHDPETGEDLTGRPWAAVQHVDVHVPDEPAGTPEHLEYVDLSSDDVPRSFREFTVFIHDEPEIHSGLHAGGEHSVMPLSYRAEPMSNRLPHRMREYARRTPAEVPADQAGVDRTAVEIRYGEELEEQFWTARRPDGTYLERVAGEEQHHSSWLFGEPATPVLRAYRGDPARLRLVHAGVKETHVYHLHVHQWRAVPQDVAPPGVWGVAPDGSPLPKGSQLLDSITIGPQTGVTIDPLYGSGSRQHAVGDVIWHCHLYPHFHHGMWGLWRSFDRYVDGSRPYPDGTPCPELRALPGRRPPDPEIGLPGFPWFVDGVVPMKSPPPPATGPGDMPGRRILLGMDPHSPAELAAMAPEARDGSSPGALFVPLDSQAAAWNARAGLPPPRLLSYDVEVVAAPVRYTVDGWHDPVGHHYRLLRAQVRTRTPDARWVLRDPQTDDVTLDHPPAGNPEPFYPRANQGDIVELALHNSLRSFPADGFDLGQPPVECGLHVHLVKFDVLAADGSATGWNYLSGASCREAVGGDGPGEQRTVSRHRWVVDEEFGPCFFHDHLLANFRQKHGLYAALIAEPPGSQWLQPQDQSVPAWSEPEAVVVPPEGAGTPPFREACIGIGDFVPLLDEGGRPLNPPSSLSGDDDPGSMAVNYRSAPLTHRGEDPSLWFSTAARSRPNLRGEPGDPDTPVIRAYPGERLRIRLVQGSHEEQHSFSTHGLRWRRDWGNPRSPLVNQQSIGISEAFTLEIGEPGLSDIGPGDHLWQFGSMDDLWTGCWGYVRVLAPVPRAFEALAPLPDLGDDLEAARARMRRRHLPPRPPAGAGPEEVRTYVVVVRRAEHRYAGHHLTDPWGLQYHLADYDPAEHARARGQAGPGPGERAGQYRPATVHPADGPLVLRARRGEWVRVVLVNEIRRDDDVEAVRLPPFGVEPSPPRLPLEHLDELGWPDERSVSTRVSLHPSLLSYDVRTDDGAYVGRNQDGTVPAIPDAWGGHGPGPAGHGGRGRVLDRGGHHGWRNWTEYLWYADEALAPASHTEGPGTVCLLQDMADVRNHRHHGLVGALVVEPGDLTPWRRGSSASCPDGWSGVECELRDPDGVVRAREGVVVVQDGLRLFVGGHPDLPVPDVVPLEDPEDSGHKAVNFRTALVHRGVPPAGALADPPLLTAEVGDRLWLHVVGAGDKPRQHSLTVHGMAWPQAPWVAGGPWVGSLSGVVHGFACTLEVLAGAPGDHAVRSGAFRWGSELGVWATLRVLGPVPPGAGRGRRRGVRSAARPR